MKPKFIKAIYDNHGTKDETFDRYTVIFNTHEGHHILFDCLALSHNPASPQGISEFSTCAVGSHLGRKISWEKLPFEIRGHVAFRTAGI